MKKDTTGNLRRVCEGEMKKRKTLPKMLRCGGAVIEEFKKCGKANCRCASGRREDLHGPYFYRFFRDFGRLRREYIPRNEAEEKKRECDEEREVKRALRAAVSESRARLRGLPAWLRDGRDDETKSINKERQGTP